MFKYLIMNCVDNNIYYKGTREYSYAKTNEDVEWFLLMGLAFVHNIDYL